MKLIPSVTLQDDFSPLVAHVKSVVEHSGLASGSYLPPLPDCCVETRNVESIGRDLVLIRLQPTPEFIDWCAFALKLAGHRE